MKIYVRLLLLLLLSALPVFVRGQDVLLDIQGQQIFAPGCMKLHNAWEGPATVCPTKLHDSWHRSLEFWREERRIYLAYDGKRYEMPTLKWTQSSFYQPQVMVHDRFFYDPVAGRYTVDKFLEDVDRRYGGVDAVLIWSTYPNMGVDDRNQLQMLASMPGGLEGVKEMVADFHKHGVRVLFPMMMWDQGTNKPEKPWPDAIAEVMREIDADGINGDTQDGVSLGFFEAAEKAGHPLVFEPEDSSDDGNLGWDLLTWGQYQFPFIPAVDRLKWLDPRHMVNISDRWAQDKTNDLQYAFFNGVGWESWENIWGVWNGITPRDAEATRRVSAMEREFARFLVSNDWEPLYPMHNFGVYSSRWPLGDETLWTIVNRNQFDLDGGQLDVRAVDGMHYYDLYHGVEIKPEKNGENDTLYFPIEANGYMGILATASKLTANQQAFLAKMRQMTHRPLNTYAHEWKFLPQKMVETGPSVAAKDAPDGMILVPGGEFLFKVHGVEVEGGDMPGLDVQYTWEDTPHRFHERKLTVKPFFIDKYPVTNAEFKKFLDASNYAPKDRENFLNDWKDGKIPPGWDNRPVTWVSMEDARAYARWAGKRLPHEWEWQFAAQGTDGRLYPWGNQLYANAQDQQTGTDPLKSGFYFPARDTGRTMRGPDPVDAHPSGGSPFGVMDMVGNVWQWTDEYYDEHTRAAILRGGEYYAPQGSIWYFPDVLSNDTHGKLLLMAPGIDRSGGIGFRCVKDVAAAPSKTVKN